MLARLDRLAIPGAGVTIRVGIADDQPLVRPGFAAMVRQTDDLIVVGEAGDGSEAIGLASRR